MAFQATKQQSDAISCFPKVTEKKPLIIKARAGTGKTTLIEEGTKSHKVPTLLLCFNTEIKKHAELRMPPNVTCKTFAGLAWNVPLQEGLRNSTYGRIYGSVKNERGLERVRWRFLTGEYAKRFRVEEHIIHASRLTLECFVSTADRVINSYHIPKYLWMGKPKEEQKGFCEEVVSLSRKMWRMKENPKDKLMPVYWNDIIKMVQIEGDIIRMNDYDLIIVDEAQDITACVLDLIKQLRKALILVGDDFQRLYAFIRTINSLDELEGVVKYLTESLRFDEVLASAANDTLDLLQHKSPRLIGSGPPTKISYDEPKCQHTVLCRTNSGLLEEAIKAVRLNKRINVMGDLMGSIKQLESGYYLSIGQLDRVTHGSLIGMKDWSEVESLKEYDPNLQMMYNQVIMYGNRIPHFCEELEDAGEVPEHKAEIVLSTVHKAKGREWNHVRMSRDFPKLIYFSENDRAYKVKKHEVYTAYVAITRARSTLYANDILGQCKAWKELL